jgi:hypothetical protein
MYLMTMSTRDMGRFGAKAKVWLYAASRYFVSSASSTFGRWQKLSNVRTDIGFLTNQVFKVS